MVAMSTVCTSTGQIVGLRIKGNITAYAEVLLDYTQQTDALMDALGLSATTDPVAFRLTQESAAIYAAPPDGIATHKWLKGTTFYPDFTSDSYEIECVLLSPEQYNLAPALLEAGWLVGRRG